MNISTRYIKLNTGGSDQSGGSMSRFTTEEMMRIVEDSIRWDTLSRGNYRALSAGGENSSKGL